MITFIKSKKLIIFHNFCILSIRRNRQMKYITKVRAWKNKVIKKFN